MVKHIKSTPDSPSKGSSTSTTAHPIEQLIVDYQKSGLSNYEIRITLAQELEIPCTVIDKYLPTAELLK